MVVRALNESNSLHCWPLWQPRPHCQPLPLRPSSWSCTWSCTCWSFPLSHSATSQEAYNNTMPPAAPIRLSHCANQYWSCNLPHLPFGNTYHSWFLTNWIRQTLGANINLTFAQHLFCSIHKNYTPQLRQTQPDPYPNTIGHSTMIRPAAHYSMNLTLSTIVMLMCPRRAHPHLSYPTHSDGRTSFIFISRYLTEGTGSPGRSKKSGVCTCSILILKLLSWR
jgi:hypothetical protein